MIKVDDIKNVTFRKSGFGGYKAFEVDSFIDKILESYENLQNENMRLLAEVEGLKERLSVYKEEESGIRNALLSAQKLADASLLDADNKAKSVLLDASRKADEIMSNAKQEVSRQKELAWDIRAKLEKFQSELVRICIQQIDEVKKIGGTFEQDQCQDAAGSDKNSVSDTQVVKTKNKDDSVISVEFNKHEEPVETSKSSTDENVENSSSDTNVHTSGILEDIYSNPTEQTEDLPQKRKLKNLKFGEKFRNGSHEFGKGLYSGLFRRKN